VDSTPAAATTNPDDVARNAAIAPAATSAASRLPTVPPTATAGHCSSIESADSPGAGGGISWCISTPAMVGNR